MRDQSETKSTTSRRRSFWTLRIFLFIASLLVAAGAVAARFWPIDRDNLLLITGPDGKQGYINLGGRVVIEPEWHVIGEFDAEGMAKVAIGDNWSYSATGWINREGKIIGLTKSPQLPGDFGPEGLCKFYEWLGYSGLMNREGKQVFPPGKFDRIATGFDGHGLIRIAKGGKAGWINTRGEIVIPPTWDEALAFDEEGMAAVRKGESWGWINLRGEVVAPIRWGFVISDSFLDNEFKYKFIPKPNKPSPFGDSPIGKPGQETACYFDAWGLAAVFDASASAWGCINRNGEVVIPPTYDRPYQFDAGGMARFEQNEMWGWANTKGELVIEPAWENTLQFNSHGLAAVRDFSQKWGWVNRDGKVVIEPQWWLIEDFGPDGLARVCERDLPIGRKWGFVNTRGEIVHPPTWQMLTPFDERGMARVRSGREWGCINRQGETVVEPRWKEMTPFDGEGMAAVQTMDLGRWGWIDRSGEVVIEPIVDVPSFHSDSGMMGSDGEIHATRPYQAPPLFDSEGMARVWSFGKMGYIDRKGQAVVPIRYQYLNPFDNNGLAFATEFPPSSVERPYVGSFPGGVDVKITMGKGNYINRSGELVLTLPGEDWRWVTPSPAEICGKPDSEIAPAYVATTETAEVQWIRRQILRFTHWVNDDSTPIPETEHACVVYDPVGNLIWDSRKLRFEHRCWVVFGFALLVALLTIPFKFFRGRKESG